jgi:hypothetical protein
MPWPILRIPRKRQGELGVGTRHHQWLVNGSGCHRGHLHAGCRAIRFNKLFMGNAVQKTLDAEVAGLDRARSALESGTCGKNRRSMFGTGTVVPMTDSDRVCPRARHVRRHVTSEWSRQGRSTSKSPPVRLHAQGRFDADGTLRGSSRHRLSAPWSVNPSRELQKVRTFTCHHVLKGLLTRLNSGPGAFRVVRV